MTHPRIVQLPPWLAHLAGAGTRLADGLWLLGDTLDAAARHHLEHVAGDLIEIRCARRLSGEVAADAGVLAAAVDGQAVEVVAVSRGLRPVATALSERLVGAGVEVCVGARDCVVIGRGYAWVGRGRLPWQRDRFNRAAARRLRQPEVSRAEVKWLQTAPLLEALGLGACHVKHWLELGAAPGGMTAGIVASGGRVTALDKAPLDASVAALDGVAAVEADALVWTPPEGARYGGLVCDLNGPPGQALDAVARLAAWLQPGAPVVVTLKWPGWQALGETPDVLAARVLAPAGLQVVRWQHLYAHRANETIVIAQRGAVGQIGGEKISGSAFRTYV